MAECTNSEVPFRRDKELVCVEYPGIVTPETVNKMIHTLGGIDNLSTTYSNPTHRLELRYRPDDAFCKPAYGDRFNTTRVLMKVTRRVPTKSAGTSLTDETSSSSPPPQITYRSEILGIIDHTYKFESMMDFQYLPMERSEDGTYRSLVAELVPTKLEPRSWIQQDTPAVLLPIVFSRIDRPSDHPLRVVLKPRTPSSPADEKAAEADETAEDTATDKPEDRQSPTSALISRFRKRRNAFPSFASFNMEAVPAAPNPNTMKIVSYCPPQTRQQVVQAFEDRPIWSRNALTAALRIDKLHLKLALPSIAYYFTSGPWRSLWVRFGYDPRSEASAKIYQTLDFRVRRALGRAKMPNACIGRSRFGSSNVVAVKFTSTIQQKAMTIQKDTLNEPNRSESPAVAEEEWQRLDRYYKFRSGVLPPLHQMFYQLTDIELPEVQTLMHSNDGRETTCKMKGGWYPQEMLQRCLEFMTVSVRKTYEEMAKSLNSETDVAETAKSEKKSESPAYESDTSEIEEEEDEEKEILPSDSSDEEAGTSSKTIEADLMQQMDVDVDVDQQEN